MEKSYIELVIEINKLFNENKILKQENEFLTKQLSLAEQLLKSKSNNEAKYVGIGEI